MILLSVIILLQANPLIQAMVDSVSSDTIRSNIQRLQDFGTRWPSHDSCFAASAWLYNKFVSYGLDSVYHDTFTTNPPVPPNIVGVKKGILHPDSCYIIICGHFDSWGSPDIAPGADDNASGTAAVLEAARIMSRYRFEFNVRFIAFSAEELGMIGSEFYAYRARARGDDIRAVLNFDMIGYADAAPENIEVCGRLEYENLIDHFIACADTYATLLTSKRLDLQVSDDRPFSEVGYTAIGMIEDFPLNNPYWHTPGDTIGGGFNDLAFCTEVIKTGIATLASSSRPVGIVEENVQFAQTKNLIVTYPNPCRDKLTIQLLDSKTENGLLCIYDATGRLIKTLLNHAILSAPIKLTWNCADNSGKKVAPGVYFLKLQTRNFVTTRKFLVVK